MRRTRKQVDGGDEKDRQQIIYQAKMYQRKENRRIVNTRKE